MIQYSEVAGHDLVLQHGAGGDVDPVPVVGDDDDRAAETHCDIVINGVMRKDEELTAFAEGDVSGDGEVVQLQDVGDGAEPGEEGGHLLELAVPELHERRGGEHPQRGHLERAVLQAVEVGHDEQEVAGLLDGEEPRPRHVHPGHLLEALHGGAHGGLQLEDVDAAAELLGVDDDLHVEGVLLQHALDGGQADPQVVGVEHVKLLHRLEVFFMLFGHLN